MQVESADVGLHGLVFQPALLRYAAQHAVSAWVHDTGSDTRQVKSRWL